MKPFHVLFASLFFFSSCTYRPDSFSPTTVPLPPDYSRPESWAALPEKEDMADKVPNQEPAYRQDTLLADVFFLHPTTYTRKGYGWNASISDAKINEKTDQTTILYQASIFNAAGRVFAPRYRQAHLQAFFSKDKVSADEALHLAYRDIRHAFQYYLDHYNEGRPVILAAHSQGALHGKTLLRDFVDGTALQDRLVVAYLVGWPIGEGDFDNIPACTTPSQTGCVCSWRTFKHGYIPPEREIGDRIIVTNPLSWATDETLVPKSLNEGAVILDFDRVFPQLADAQVYKGILWAHKPRFPGSFFFMRRNYHIADLNFYYMNVRSNAKKRASIFRQ